MGGRPAFVGLLAAIEVVFTFLAERLAADPRAYHLQGALVGPARRFIADTWARLYVPAPDDPRQAQLAAFLARRSACIPVTSRPPPACARSAPRDRRANALHPGRHRATDLAS